MNAKAVTAAPTESPAAPRKEAPGITKRSSAYFLDPKTITRRPGWNPRFVFTEIEEQADTLVENGQLNPIRVKRLEKGDARLEAGALFELIDGDRRLSSIELLLKKHGGDLSKAVNSKGEALLADGIQAYIVDKNQDDKTSFIQMFVANEGKAFLPLEEAAAYKRMRDPVDQGGYGMSIKEICQAVGRASMHVTEVLALASADESVKEAVGKGEVGKTQAKNIAKTARGDKVKQAELLALAKKAKGGDKAARKALALGLDAKKRTNAAAKGKTLKIRALSDEELSKLGEQVHLQVVKLMKEAALPDGFDLRAWVEKDDKLALAAAYGALEALKAGAGMKISLDF